MLVTSVTLIDCWGSEHMYKYMWKLTRSRRKQVIKIVLHDIVATGQAWILTNNE